jgi:hypothetical protein
MAALLIVELSMNAACREAGFNQIERDSQRIESARGMTGLFH